VLEGLFLPLRDKISNGQHQNNETDNQAEYNTKVIREETEIKR